MIRSKYRPCIYVATTDKYSFPCVKIGYTEDLTRRIVALNKYEKCNHIPYCYLEVPRAQRNRYPDVYIHEILTTINPDIRVEGGREYFNISPKDAAHFLQMIGSIFKKEIVYPIEYISKIGKHHFDGDKNIILEKYHKIEILYTPRQRCIAQYIHSEYGNSFAVLPLPLSPDQVEIYYENSFFSRLTLNYNGEIVDDNNRIIKAPVEFSSLVRF